MRQTQSRERVRLPAVGGSALLVIFAVLCLTVFALLGLSTVQANDRLSDASADAIQGYYAADCEAEAILARLRAGESVEGVTETDGVCHYQCSVSDTQALSVAVSLDGDSYTILQWTLVSTLSWQAEESLTVWDGETP